MIDIIATGIFFASVYLMLGGLTQSLVFEENPSVPVTRRWGVTIIWPLFALRFLGWMIGGTAKSTILFFKNNAHKWVVIPVTIGKIFKGGFKTLLFGTKDLETKVGRSERIAKELMSTNDLTEKEFLSNYYWDEYFQEWIPSR